MINKKECLEILKNCEGMEINIKFEDCRNEVIKIKGKIEIEANDVLIVGKKYYHNFSMNENIKNIESKEIEEIIIKKYYNEIGNILFTNKLIPCIPKLEIVKTKKYNGQITRNFLKLNDFEKVEISTNNFKGFYWKEKLIQTIIHEFAHMVDFTHNTIHKKTMCEFENILKKAI